MKILVVGGTSGLGKLMAEHLGAHAIGRSTGHAVPDNKEEIINMSLEYDCVINCIPDSNQNSLLFSMYEQHDNLGKSTYFITVGSMSWRLHSADSDHSKRVLFNWSEHQILRPTKIRHTLLNPAWLWNSPDQTDISKVGQEEMIKTIDFLLSLPYNSTIHLLEIKGTYNAI
jgi:hypothetical protein